MYGHWFLVASRQTAKIYTEVAGHARLKLIKEFDNPLSRASKSELVRHEGATGGVRTTGTRSAVRYGGEQNDPRDFVADDFAREIAAHLLKELDKKNYVSLTVVAEARFLGKLRSAMKPRVDGHVMEWMRKDLIKIPDILLPEFLLKHARRERADEENEVIELRETTA